MGNTESIQENFEIKRYVLKENSVLDKTNIIKKENLIFYLNSLGETAYVVGNDSSDRDVLVPTYIEHENKKYYVTCIFKNSFSNSNQIRSIQFSSDSNLLVIGSETFSRSTIEMISIPPSVLQIKTAAFSYCHNLKHIEFPINSKLQTIESYTFCKCIIERITIPSSVTKICSSAFQNCHDLKTIEFQSDSKIQLICNNAFFDSSVESILSIPSSVKLDDNWCNFTYHLSDIKISPRKVTNIEWYDNKFLIGKTNKYQDNFDVLMFVPHKTESFTIPSFIKEIGVNAFNAALIQYIFIPSQVTCIHDYAFNRCKYLKQVDIPSNSELEIIYKSAFSGTAVKSLYIPSKIKKVVDFLTFYEFKIIEFASNSLINIITESLFSSGQDLIIMIPPGKVKMPELNLVNLTYGW